MSSAGKFILTGFKNCLKCSAGKSEGFAHKDLKSKICLWAWENSVTFFTEVSFVPFWSDGCHISGGRADLVLDSFGVGIEVLSSEDFSKFLVKKSKYPIPTIPLLVSIEDVDLYSLLEELKATQGAAAEFYRRKILQNKAMSWF